MNRKDGEEVARQSWAKSGVIVPELAETDVKMMKDMLGGMAGFCDLFRTLLADGEIPRVTVYALMRYEAEAWLASLDSIRDEAAA